MEEMWESNIYFRTICRKKHKRRGRECMKVLWTWKRHLTGLIDKRYILTYMLFIPFNFGKESEYDDIVFFRYAKEGSEDEW